MLFTWSTQDLCIVFRGWHITNTFTLIVSLLLIVALGAGYEAVREASRRYEAATEARLTRITQGTYTVTKSQKANSPEKRRANAFPAAAASSIYTISFDSYSLDVRLRPTCKSHVRHWRNWPGRVELIVADREPATGGGAVD